MLPHMDINTLAAVTTDSKTPPRADVALAPAKSERQLPGIATGLELDARFAAKGWENSRVRSLHSRSVRKHSRISLIGALFIVAERPLKLEDKARNC